MSEHEHDHEQDAALVRRAGHIILDGVTAAEVDNDDALEIAFGRLLEIEAIEVTMDEEEGQLELDISTLMGGVLLVVSELVAELAQRDGTGTDEVLARIRSRIEG